MTKILVAMAVFASGVSAFADAKCSLFAETAKGEWSREFYQGAISGPRTLLVDPSLMRATEISEDFVTGGLVANGEIVVSLAPAHGNVSLRIGTSQDGKIKMESAAFGRLSDIPTALISVEKKIAVTCVEEK